MSLDWKGNVVAGELLGTEVCGMFWAAGAGET